MIGKTGMGKSTLLCELALADARAGRGFLLLDPHGDLAQDVRRSLPSRRKNDVVLIDPLQLDACPGLNPLRSVVPEDRSLVVSNVLATMRRLWDAGLWGPRTEHVLRHVLLALLEVRGATLLDARDLLIDPRRREAILRQVHDPHVQAFWAQEFVGYGKAFVAEIAAPVLNKLGALLGNPVVRSLVTKSRPRLDARRLLDRGAIVLAPLPRGRLGEDATVLMGGLLLGAFQAATLGRADCAISERPPFFVFVDEVGSFVSTPLLALVAEARKFGVGLVLATQSLAVLDPPVRQGLLGNIGTLVSFRVGADDAELVARELTHEVRAEHLMRFGAHEAVVRVGASRPVVLGPSPRPG
ncbi:MAG: hypothetical protein U0441_23325 [Polyangiaceae bacterium]